MNSLEIPGTQQIKLRTLVQTLISEAKTALQNILKFKDLQGSLALEHLSLISRISFVRSQTESITPTRPWSSLSCVGTSFTRGLVKRRIKSPYNRAS
jgi:hypothetical protein